MNERVCKIGDCGRKCVAKGLCGIHRERDILGLPMDLPIRHRGHKMDTCTHPGCSRPWKCSGYCAAHYTRWLRGKPLDTPIRGSFADVKCAIPNCGRAFKEKRSKYGQLCATHEHRVRHGKDMATPIRSKVASVGDLSPSGQGYILVKTPQMEWRMYHQVIMEQHIGRLLYPHENVHHINGIRDDNRLENLELWSHSQPSGQRVADKTAWAIEWLTQYGYTVAGAVQMPLDLAAS